MRDGSHENEQAGNNDVPRQRESPLPPGSADHGRPGSGATGCPRWRRWQVLGPVLGLLAATVTGVAVVAVPTCTDSFDRSRWTYGALGAADRGSDPDVAGNLDFPGDAVLAPSSWNYDLGGLLGRFAVDRDGVRKEYVMEGSTIRGTYRAIDPHTGKQLWVRPLPDGVSWPFEQAVGEGHLRMARIDPATGDPLWCEELPHPGRARDPLTSGFADLEETIGFVQSASKLNTFDAASGELRWAVDLHPMGRQAVAGDGIVVVLQSVFGERDWGLTAYDTRSGERLWQTASLPRADPGSGRGDKIAGLLGVRAGRVLVATADDGDGPARVHAFDLGGTLRWSAPIRPFRRQDLPPATLTDDLLVTSSVGPDGLQALRLDDGTVAWTAALELSLTPPTVRDGRRLFIGDPAGLIALGLDTGEFEISAVRCGDLTVADGVLVCGKGTATVAYPLR